MYFKQIKDEKLAQYSYLIGCQQTGEAIIIDPMRDIDRYEKLAHKERMRIVAAGETHIHADYLSGLRQFAESGAKVYASDEGDANWKYEWLQDSDYNYALVHDGDMFNIGNIGFWVRFTPGHTPEHISFLVTDGATTNEPMGLLSGDFVFVGDVGRPDLLESAAGQKGAMESSANTLFESVQKFKLMPEYLQLWPGHGSGSACGKALGAVPESTVGYEQRFNPAIQSAQSRRQFVENVLDGQPEPPLYFARMKEQNKRGPKVLSKLPNPARTDIHEMLDMKTEQTVILDTRNTISFMNKHIPGSILSTFNKNFNTIAGSYIEERQPIYLVIDENNLEQAVRDLVRVGLDDIKGYATPADLQNYFESGGKSESIAIINFEEANSNKAAKPEAFQFVDVRNISEWETGHKATARHIVYTRLAAHTDELPKDKTLLVHCAIGGRAGVAAALLAHKGFDVRFIKDHISNGLRNEDVEV